MSKRPRNRNRIRHAVLRAALPALCLAVLLPARGEDAPDAGAGAAPDAGAGAAPAPVERAGEARAAHEDRVRELLRAMGREALAEQVIRRTVDGLRQSLPQVPAAFWSAFEAGIDPAELLELQVPAYAEALAPEDVPALIAFYRSPLGRRLVAAQAAASDDLQAAGERWGQALARRALRRLEEAGY